jgi:hypothetical protein
VTVPTIRGRLQDAYEDSLISEFDNLASAVTAYRQDVGHYPPNLDYLTALPGSPVDHCGHALSATAQANWRGPYVTRTIRPVTYYFVATKDSVRDTLVSISAPIGLYIQVQGPDFQTTFDVDTKIDGVANGTAGTLQWQTNGTDDFILKYIIPTKSGAC